MSQLTKHTKNDKNDKSDKYNKYESNYNQQSKNIKIKYNSPKYDESTYQKKVVSASKLENYPNRSPAKLTKYSPKIDIEDFEIDESHNNNNRIKNDNLNNGGESRRSPNIAEEDYNIDNKNDNNYYNCQ